MWYPRSLAEQVGDVLVAIAGYENEANFAAGHFARDSVHDLPFL
jgi:hypothetical protein